MKGVELYGRVRHAVRIEGLSERAAARRFGLDPRTVNKMMKFSVPPGYVRKKPPAKPKLDAFVPMIDRILGDDKSRPKKQQHTAKRTFERLRDEHGFTGGITIVKDYVAGWRQRAQEMFVPLVHPPGHAQADFGEAIGIIGGVERKIHFFAFDLPHSDACFVVGYPAETDGSLLRRPRSSVCILRRRAEVKKASDTCGCTVRLAPAAERGVERSAGALEERRAARRWSVGVSNGASRVPVPPASPAQMRQSNQWRRKRRVRRRERRALSRESLHERCAIPPNTPRCHSWRVALRSSDQIRLARSRLECQQIYGQ